MNEPRTIQDLRELGVELSLSPDKMGVQAREVRPEALTPEVRAAVARHEASFLKTLLFREAATFVARRLEAAGLSWLDPGYHAAVLAFDAEDRLERLDEAWTVPDPESVKDVLRLCARSSVGALTSHTGAAAGGREDDGTRAPPPDNGRVPSNGPSGARRANDDGRGEETGQQLTLDAS